MSDWSKEVYGTGCSVNLGLGWSVCSTTPTVWACRTVSQRALEPQVASAATSGSET
jgi:hypothetical protein